MILDAGFLCVFVPFVSLCFYLPLGLDPEKLTVAHRHKACVEIGIRLDEGDKGRHLLYMGERIIHNQQAARPEDALLVFLDSERSEYVAWWLHVKRILRPGGLLVVDNALSHVEEMAPFVALVKADPDFNTSLVPVGNGEFLGVKIEG